MITADIINNSGTFTGKAEVTLVNSDSLTEPFTYDNQKSYVPESKEITVEGNKIFSSIVFCLVLNKT